MRSSLFSAVFAVCLIAPAAAQTQGGYAPAYPPNRPAPPPPSAPPPAYSDTNGGRPGNVVGTGMSLPRGTRASNIDQDNTRSLIAPNLPSPTVGPDASPAELLRAAQNSLSAGRTGETQQALEMAQTRLLDRSVAQGQTLAQSRNPAVAQISQALRALAAGDRAQTMQLIQAAIPEAQAMAR